MTTPYTVPTQADPTPYVDLEWALAGARHFSDSDHPSDIMVVVDVLSFSTSVTVACERGAKVWPHPGGEAAHQLARSIEAVLAGTRSHTAGPSLSPASLLALPPDSRLVLPSPNGSSIAHALMSSKATVLIGCLRNAAAVAAEIAQGMASGARSVAIIAAGERWSDGSLRVAYEDLVGAGAVIQRLVGLRLDVRLSPQALAAMQAFDQLADLRLTPSGRDLIERDFALDVALASEVDACSSVPVLRDGAFLAS